MKYTNHLRFAKWLSELLDTKFRVAGVKFGIDPILGVIPGFGDLVPAFFSLYLVWLGVKMNIPNSAVTEMLRNIFADLILGLVPVLGDLLDFTFKASSRNYRILENAILEVKNNPLA